MSAQQVELIKTKLFWICDQQIPETSGSQVVFYMNSVKFKQKFSYKPFCYDFGPVNIGIVYRFCTSLHSVIQHQSNRTKRIVVYTTPNYSQRANSAFLCGAYLLLYCGKSAEESFKHFADVKFPDFRDASACPTSFPLSIKDCLYGLSKAIQLGWFSIQNFNIEQYEQSEQLENGDWSWIIPNKLMAFSCPSNTSHEYPGLVCYTPEDYSALFLKLGVKTVIRLNKKVYNSQRFSKYKIDFHDLFFLDGSCPSKAIISKFISIVENAKGAVGVHCKAGLGRTGTLIGCYAMKHFDISPKEYIAWARLARPGSVLGPQQHFLIEIEGFCKNHICNNRVVSKSVDITPSERIRAKIGESGQAGRLVSVKRKEQATPSRVEWKRLPMMTPQKPRYPDGFQRRTRTPVISKGSNYSTLRAFKLNY